MNFDNYLTNENDAETLYWKGFEYEKMEEDDKAFKCYEKAVTLNHNYAIYRLGRCYEKKIGTHRSSIAALKAAECYEIGGKDVEIDL
ncbi:6928_t:CDS:2, partial [Cetraspora pellucida]